MIENINNEPEVISEITEGNKIYAIKLLRRKSGLGLKEAKLMVEVYISENDLPSHNSKNVGSNSNWIFLIIFAVLGFYIFKNYF